MTRRPSDKDYGDGIYLDPKDEVEACLKCKLPDCIPKHRACELAKLLEKKRGKPVVLK